jgi:chromosomal replication initiation ATPase DnaA
MLLDRSVSDSPRRADADDPSPRLICLCIAACVALDFGLKAPDLFASKSRSTRTAHARQIAMYLAHVGFGLPFDVIGRHFLRDRTTVGHACRVIEDARDDRWLDCRLTTLEEVCRGALAEAGGVR